MFSSFGLLGVESRDFSHAEEEKTACNAEQIHKMTTISLKMTNLGPIWVKIQILKEAILKNTKQQHFENC